MIRYDRNRVVSHETIESSTLSILDVSYVARILVDGPIDEGGRYSQHQEGFLVREQYSTNNVLLVDEFYRTLFSSSFPRTASIVLTNCLFYVLFETLYFHDGVDANNVFLLL